MPYVFTALTLVFAGIYAFIRRGGSLSNRLFFKTAASVMFVLVAVSLHLHSDEPYYTLIVIGLCLAAAGDVLMVLTDVKPGCLTGGMVCFLLTHVCYIAAFSSESAPSLYDGAFFLLLVAVAAGVFQKRLPKGKKTMAAIAYALVLMVMAARAFSLLFAPRVNRTYALFAALGGVLFAVSDMLLGIESKYRAHKRAAGMLSTFTYYAGQVFIAWSVMI